MPRLNHGSLEKKKQQVGCRERRESERQRERCISSTYMERKRHIQEMSWLILLLELASLKSTGQASSPQTLRKELMLQFRGRISSFSGKLHFCF